MKKLVLVVAMFMFVCSGTFFVKAQNAAEVVTSTAKSTTIVNDTIVNDTVVTDTASKDKPAEPAKE